MNDKHSRPKSLSPKVSFAPMLPTPPLTPSISSPSVPCSPIKRSEAMSAVKIPTVSSSSSYSNSLQIPLKAHLAFLHPATPANILSFCATRLLSRERPYGFDEDRDWVPIQMCEEGFDLQTVGLGREASKSMRKGQNGPGRAVDERLEKQYEVARRSFKLLEVMAPRRGSAL
ncbi:uncharacterized protein L203_104541 [Cryptococcus depauperatus CBS 7841]|uniref:Uncharacterized protein n=1 Tax=Cryptococcus depauperatus CBS 7841 TaxID=1295531 RepID=A0A1E3ILS1_9TREE|nr:hypothetical protein L203_02262 [Cryptococcus depauperatus CBS 7841]